VTKPPAPLDAESLNFVYRRIRSLNAFEEVTGRLARAIRLGLIEGDRLPPERELAARLGVSRVTLRDVIKGLTDAGYVESRQGRGGGTFITFRHDQRRTKAARTVARSMGTDLVDAMAFRDVIEPGAAELLAINGATVAQLDTLRALCDGLPDRSSFRTNDIRFHLSIAEFAGSPSLTAAVADLQDRLTELLGSIPLLDTALEHSCAQHRHIVDCIEQRDAQGAHDAMRDHISATRELLLGFLT
jgi:DNA-binding FadR family transcriptional regulator